MHLTCSSSPADTEGQIVTILGLGGWFPYAAVSLWSGPSPQGIG
jgi:hypothetical protein